VIPFVAVPASLCCEIWRASTHRAFQRVSEIVSSILKPHKLSASILPQPGIPCGKNCLRSGKWSTQQKLGKL